FTLSHTAATHRDLHSFPTRRSSDLLLQDRLDFFPQVDAVAAIEGSLGRKIDDLYLQFDAPIAAASMAQVHPAEIMKDGACQKVRSEEHTSELQSRENLVCRLLLEKK